MRKTGFFDKNGKELLEGDIFHTGDKRIKSVVVWHDNEFIGKQIGTYGSYIGLEYHRKWIEVVGNINQNSEQNINQWLSEKDY